MKKVLVALAIVGTTTLPGILAAADAAAGKAKAASCDGCHVAGSPTAPVLAGMSEMYLVKATKAYQTGERADATMKAMVAALSDDDIANLAAHYAAEKPCK